MTKLSLNAKDFRSALGSFATGVTVVTTLSSPKNPVGVTASSFNSVSLDPPLVLWSLDKKSSSLDAFMTSGHFVVHILSAQQEAFSNNFAKPGADKFAHVTWESGELGSPVFSDFAARFECKTVHQYEGGDHIIFVGEVIAYDKRDAAPLVFHAGRYAETREKIKESDQPSVEIEQGRFTEDFFLYLMSRAHFQTSQITRQSFAKFGIDQSEYLTITLLAMNAPMEGPHIVARLDHTGQAPTEESLGAMQQKDLIAKNSEGYSLTQQGRDIFIATLSATKAFEDDLLAKLSPSEIHETKRVLKKIIELTGTDIPPLWS